MLQHRFKLAFKLFITAVLLAGLVSCTIFISKSEDLDDREEKDSVLIFGYLNDTTAPFIMKWGDIKQVRPATDEPVKDLRSNNQGLFYLENLPVGSYKITTLGGPEKGLSNSFYDWDLPQTSEDEAFKRMEIRAKKPGLYFVGSYAINKIKDGGFFGSDKYETIATTEVSEKQALEKLLVYAAGTGWDKTIKARLKQLK